MRMIRAVVVCLSILGVCAVTQVTAYESVVTNVPKFGGPVYNMNMVTMHGNYTWIPLNLKGTPENNKIYILGALNAFEEKFPIEVLSFQIEKQQSAYVTSKWVHGIWVHHKPKIEQ